MKIPPISEQTIVITGASSGIGLATARRAAQQGANLVLVARNINDLHDPVQHMRDTGAHVISVAADVASQHDLQRVADRAIEAFGHIDTWVNNAGITVIGPIEEVDLDDHRKLFETNFWGVVNGSLVAAEHMRGRGGVIINVGSAVSERAIPLQGMYSASKHAVKGFTDALRMELEHDDAGIAMCLVKPASIATEYTRHAKNVMDHVPRLPPPVYDPDIVAEAIVHCAAHPRRDVYVGSASRAFAFMDRVMPRVTDHLMEWTLYDAQQTDIPAEEEPDDSLWTPGEDGQERGGHAQIVRQRSVYTRAQLHPLRTAAAAVGLGAMVYAGTKILGGLRS